MPHDDSYKWGGKPKLSPSLLEGSDVYVVLAFGAYTQEVGAALVQFGGQDGRAPVMGGATRSGAEACKAEETDPR